MKGLSVLLFVSACFALLLAACVKDSEDRLAAASGAGSCDTTGVKYSTAVVPILQNNCYPCHGQNSNAGSGGIVLEGYDNIVSWVQKGYVLGNVSHSPGFVAMPYGKPKLPDCEVNTIVAWIHQGSLNN